MHVVDAIVQGSDFDVDSARSALDRRMNQRGTFQPKTRASDSHDIIGGVMQGRKVYAG